MADSQQGFTRWLLINGNRHAVAALLLTAIFLLLVFLGHIEAINVEDQGTVQRLAGGFIPGLIAFLTIVLAINQLVLSQEFGSAGEVQKRIEDVRKYRHNVEEMVGSSPSPVLPTRFLSFVLLAIKSEATTLEESLGPEIDPDTRETIETYARNVIDDANRAHDSLEQVQPGRINALLPVLEYNDSHQLFEARRIKNNCEGLPDETRQALSALIEALKLFSVARMQFRTTYTQRVLARLSRQLLYIGIPALVIVIVLGLIQVSGTLPISGGIRLVVVSALISIALSPLTLLSAYLFRVSVVSERTIAVGPFVSRPQTVQTNSEPKSNSK